jgi:valyl-tRNA synthetase
VKPHKLMVPRGDRTGVVIEPMLTDQWFVAMSKPGAIATEPGKSIAGKALECVASGEIKFVPENWVNTYNQWLNNIQDWCISRQLWWGHQIPAWYSDDGRCWVAHDEAEALALAQTGRLHRRPRARPRRARHLVLLGAVAFLDARLDARLAGQNRTPRSTSTCRRRCWSPASTSSSSGWRAW